MTREEEVEIISERYGANSLIYGKLHNDTLKGLLKHYQEGFVAGVKWADKNPKSPWISVEESLPKEDPKRNDYMSVEVLTITDKGYISLDTYDYQTQRWFIHSEFLVVDENDDSLGEVTHWMPIPELLKE